MFDLRRWPVAADSRDRWSCQEEQGSVDRGDRNRFNMYSGGARLLDSVRRINGEKGGARE